jgi:uncharacterized iron-regulated membrane protein
VRFSSGLQPLRRLVFWSHLVAGCVAGIIILTMSATGVLLMYERQMLAWADTHAYRTPAGSANRPRLAPDALVASARSADPSARVTSVMIASDPQAPAAAVLGTRTLYLDPHDGRVLGEGAVRLRAFFRRVTDWHRWLGSGPEGRATARAITGACNLAFLVLVVSGAYLWLPRIWTWRQIRNIAWFRGGLRGKARDFNWHNAIGVWSVVPLIVIVWSGAVISYPWASDLVYRVAGETPPPRATPNAAARGAGGAAGPARADRQAAAVEAAPSMNAAWARAEQQVAGWRTITLRLPASSTAPVTALIDRGNGGQPQKRDTLTLDPSTGQVVRWEPFESLSTGRRMRSYLRFAHTGEVAGIAGQTIAGLASAGGAVLVWTGLAMAFRRFLAWRRARRSLPVPAHATVVPAIPQE